MNPAMSPFGAAAMAPAAPAAGNNMAMGGGTTGNSWSARAQFASPSGGQQKPLDTWEKYAQMLLLANEMTFVD
jgi:hypothetical protein